MTRTSGAVLALVSGIGLGTGCGPAGGPGELDDIPVSRDALTTTTASGESRRSAHGEGAGDGESASGEVLARSSGPAHGVRPHGKPPEKPAPEPEPARFVDADVGVVSCGVKSDGTLWCWGQTTNWRGDWQQALYPARYGTDADWTSVSVGDYSVCGMRGQGSIDCFGYVFQDGAFRLDDETLRVGQADEWQSMSNGTLGGCAIKKDGSLWCWGYLNELTDGAIESSLAPQPVGTDRDWSLVATNGYRACAIKGDGSLLCFGYNDDGGLGDGTTVDRGTPTPVADPGPWLDVATGGRTCGLRADHTLWCWGERDGVTFTQVDQNTDWEQVYGHGYTTCGLRSGGKPYCFNTPGSLSAQDEQGGYTQIATSCALHSDQTLRCWGQGPRGDGQGSLVPEPVRVGTDGDWTAVVMGEWQMSGLHADGRLDTYRPPTRPEGSGWREVAAGDHTKCGIRDDGTLWCWGGDFGTNDEQYTSGNLVPLQMGPYDDWRHVAVAGRSWMCGIRAAPDAEGGSLWCQYPMYGLDLVQQGPYDDWKTISSSYTEACGVRADGSLWCWRMQYVCGVGGVPQFERVGSDNDWADADTGAGHLCAIKRDRSLWCRGYNLTGNLGVGTHAESKELVQVAPGTKWLDITAGYLASCGIQVDGSLWCWGDNRYGQLAVGWPGANRTLPERVGSDNDWDEVVLNKGYWIGIGCGLRGGELWCWGQDIDGLVRRTPPDLGPRLVLDAPTPQPDFCLWPYDYDHDGYAGCIGDCDDANADVSPFQLELCNGIDDDCDGAVDQGCAL